ncbi:hypothetical protein LCGC14_2725450 [marine sediment metagenome]|uniref:MYM-type domain-containing protein n=1 Tax=marine sediment metagenome TaxID=412755 RepID=A0A0F9C0I8_9ZZZZ
MKILMTCCVCKVSGAGKGWRYFRDDEQIFWICSKICRMAYEKVVIYGAC